MEGRWKRAEGYTGWEQASRRQRHLFHSALALGPETAAATEAIHESPVYAWISGGLLQGQEHRVQQCLHGTF